MRVINFLLIHLAINSEKFYGAHFYKRKKIIKKFYQNLCFRKIH